MQAEMQKLAQENAALKVSQEAAMQANQIKAMEVQIKEQELQIKAYEAETERMSASQVPPTPEDTSEMEALKLQYEDRWKQLEAETKVLVAQISAASKAQPEEDESEDKEEPEDNALALAMQGFTEALMQLRAPRTATLSDGRQIRVE
jgi:hypothetical protein